MSDYNRNNQSGGNRNFGKPRFNRERTEMFSATCANCGKQCEVPFRPNGNKPVLCRDCFQNSRGSDSRRPEQRTFDRPRFDRDDTQNKPNYQEQFDILNVKMDKILNLLTADSIDSKPLESEISVDTIEEIAQEVQEEKPKKAKVKKVSSSKKK